MDPNSTPPNTANTDRVFVLVLCLGTVIVIVMMLSFSYLFLRYRSTVPLLDPVSWANQRAIALRPAHLNHDGVVIGIEEQTLDSLPRMLYSKKVCQSFKSAEGNELDEGEDKKCCSICLSDYKESEVVRIIPHCGHMFHIHCIDKWLRQQATCPICRTSPLPSLRSTPLAEEAPPTTILTVHDHDSTRPFPR